MVRQSYRNSGSFAINEAFSFLCARLNEPLTVARGFDADQRRRRQWEQVPHHLVGVSTTKSLASSNTKSAPQAFARSPMFTKYFQNSQPGSSGLRSLRTAK
jgi:hypothetical protein